MKAYYGTLRAAAAKSELARQAVAAELKEAESPQRFLVHGAGLDHAEWPQKEFRAGTVICLEPMIALPERNMGFYLEDMLAVTENGTELLTAGLPYTAEEIEAFLATPARAAYTVVDAHNHMDPPQHTAERLIREMNVLGISKSIRSSTNCCRASRAFR